MLTYIVNKQGMSPFIVLVLGTQVKLENVQSAEFVCSKAIRDGVIDAVIDHDNGWIKSQELVDVYATDEPQQVLIQCIVYFHRGARFEHQSPPAVMPPPPLQFWVEQKVA